MLVSNEKNRYSVASIIEQIQQIHTKTPIEGITVLGGEPSEQSDVCPSCYKKSNNWGFQRWSIQDISMRNSTNQSMTG